MVRALGVATRPGTFPGRPLDPDTDPDPRPTGDPHDGRITRLVRRGLH